MNHDLRQIVDRIDAIDTTIAALNGLKASLYAEARALIAAEVRDLGIEIENLASETISATADLRAAAPPPNTPNTQSPPNRDVSAGRESYRDGAPQGHRPAEAIRAEPDLTLPAFLDRRVAS